MARWDGSSILSSCTKTSRDTCEYRSKHGLSYRSRLVRQLRRASTVTFRSADVSGIRILYSNVLAILNLNSTYTYLCRSWFSILNQPPEPSFTPLNNAPNASERRSSAGSEVVRFSTIDSSGLFTTHLAASRASLRLIAISPHASRFKTRLFEPQRIASRQCPTWLMSSTSRPTQIISMP